MLNCKNEPNMASKLSNGSILGVEGVQQMLFGPFKGSYQDDPQDGPKTPQEGPKDQFWTDFE